MIMTSKNLISIWVLNFDLENMLNLENKPTIG